MKYIIGACFCIFLFSECSSSGNTQTPATTDSTTVVVPQTVSIQGTYKGDFGGSPIYITINYISGKHIAGYNVHKGLRRNLSGTIQQAGDGWELLLNEPGDHAFDGKFKLLFDADYATAKGQWNPLNTPSSLKEKKFTLSREKVQSYDDADFMADITYQADHADIKFNSDGSCIFNYYDKISDSAFAQQMNTVRGTWERKASNIMINWQKNEHISKPSSVFEIIYEDYEGKQVMSNIQGEGFEFRMAF
ncbi:hypothetical protein [Chitinophaga sp. CF118]|uniref:hypothetical protein n=1 Tax=Chitinophaga sp. CF118 TaxID=1884367 RepID=UPI001160861B|nr:hypothetical protein [Chitinophaga sp. CF118]